MKITRRTIMTCGILILILTAYAGIIRTTLVINSSWSAPVWGFARVPVMLWPWPAQQGDWIQFTPPVDAPWPYVKQVRGTAGDVIAVRADRMVTINGVPVGIAKTHSLDGRPLDVVPDTIIPAGHHFVMGMHRDSHDSRYAEIGLVPDSAILARVWPLPDIPAIGLEGAMITEDRLKEAMNRD